MNTRIRLKIGQSIKKGNMVALSKAGNLRTYISGKDSCMGIALMKLTRGRIAVCDDASTGKWKEENCIDPELTAVSMSYFPETYLK